MPLHLHRYLGHAVQTTTADDAKKTQNTNTITRQGTETQKPTQAFTSYGWKTINQKTRDKRKTNWQRLTALKGPQQCNIRPATQYNTPEREEEPAVWENSITGR